MTFHQLIRPDTFSVGAAPLILEPPAPLHPEWTSPAGSTSTCCSGDGPGHDLASARRGRSKAPPHVTGRLCRSGPVLGGLLLLGTTVFLLTKHTAHPTGTLPFLATLTCLLALQFTYCLYSRHDQQGPSGP